MYELQLLKAFTYCTHSCNIPFHVSWSMEKGFVELMIPNLFKILILNCVNIWETLLLLKKFGNGNGT